MLKWVVFHKSRIVKLVFLMNYGLIVWSKIRYMSINKLHFRMICILNVLLTCLF